ncbi:hypothetical protein Ancab_009156 [Ancistrocladus abbreviatus]
MGNNEAEKPMKHEKTTSPAKEQGNVHVYPDWAAVQAYYGAGTIPGLPAPYFNPAVTSSHAPHPYMWAPPQMMPPYGSPYAAIYPHGIYGHAAPMVATPLSLETPTRSGNDSSSAKKLKESDGHATSGNANAESAGEGGAQGQSQSIDSGTEGSYDRSNDSTPQDERELKREKRKQSNRESARRSRLRKQAEMEELAKKVESLTVENMALRSEIKKLTEEMEKLKSDNAALMEKLKNVQGEVGKTVSDRTDDQGKKNINTENFLSRVNNSVSNGAHK